MFQSDRRRFLWAEGWSEELFGEDELGAVHHLADAWEGLFGAFGCLFLVLLLRLYPGQFYGTFGVFLSHGVDALFETVSVDVVLRHQLLVEFLL